MTSHRKLAAILAADVAGYSRLMADDDRATVETLNAYREVIRKHVRAHEGRVVDSPGDALLAEFPSAVEGVQCAAEIQQELARRNAQLAGHREMQFRIGINLGDVIEEDGALYGDGVNVAARLEALAEPGGLCVSGTAFDQVEGKLPLAFKFIGEQQVKNIPKPVRVYSWMTQPGPSATPKRVREKWLLRGLIGALLVGVAMFAWWSTRTPVGSVTGVASSVAGDGTASGRLAGKPRVAVLPLASISIGSTPEDEYFSDGMTEELISKLSRVDGLDVIARTSVMQYKGKEKTIADIGRELNVGTVLEGSVRQAGRKVRITVQLIDVGSQGHLWSADYDRELVDVFAIQSDIAKRVAEALQVQLMAGEKQLLERKGTENLEAYNSYLKGLYHMNKYTEEGFQTGIKHFEEAIEKDPAYAQAYLKIAFCYENLGFFGFLPQRVAFAKVKLAATKALELDATNAEAYAELGNTRIYDYDWPGAENAFKRAVELGPNSAIAHYWYAVSYLGPMKRHDEAIAEMRRALELDPLSLHINGDLVCQLHFAGRYHEVVEQARKVLAMDPSVFLALWCQGQTYMAQKKYPEAIASFQRMDAVTKGFSGAKAMLGWAYAMAGQTDQAQKLLAELNERATREEIPSIFFVAILAGLGEKDQAFKWLDKAYEERSAYLVYLKVDSWYDNLRSDPRFASLLARMKLDT